MKYSTHVREAGKLKNTITMGGSTINRHFPLKVPQNCHISKKQKKEAEA